MRLRQTLAVCASVSIVLAAYVAWETTTGNFNANPHSVSLDTVSCDPVAPPCPAFKIDSANLTVRVFQDIRSQELTLRFTATGPTRIDLVSVFFSGVPIGNFTGGLSPGSSISLGWGIPTTMAVDQGQRYTFLVRAQSDGQGTRTQLADYWTSFPVEAK